MTTTSRTTCPGRRASPGTFHTAALLAACSVAIGADDPFAGVDVVPAAPPARLAEPAWRDNLLLRRETSLWLGGERTEFEDSGKLSTRFAGGFGAQKRFSTATRTHGSFEYQGRIVFRDHRLDTATDPMGRDANRWTYETHNAYAEGYGLLGSSGRCNLRAGYFYPPFGLNQQTDTHGTLLQLSNDLVFGTERDWQATLYGALSDTLDYTVGYLAGSGPNHRTEGQSGLAVTRLALGNPWLSKHGLEGGISAAAGERVDSQAVRRSDAVHHRADGGPVVETWRVGADGRKRLDSVLGPFTLTGEATVGEDERDLLSVGLVQADWLHPSRRWGLACQYRKFWQDASEVVTDLRDTRITGVLTHYFRDDIGNSALHWIALAVEQRERALDEPEDTLAMLQYYRYW